MSALRIYIAGPMTGLSDFNYPAFFAAERALQAIGHSPINPARKAGRDGCNTWLDFMRAALHDLADSDGVALLDGWQNSRGAAIELRTADSLLLPAFRVSEWLSAGGGLP